MEAKELRIGNLVKDRGGKVIRIDWMERTKVCMKNEFNGSEVHPWTEEFEYLRPIPLNEHLLLKCGFIDSSLAMPSYALGRIRIEQGFNIFQKKTVWNVRFRFLPEKSILVTTLKYLHQLQNIWLVLNGKELNTDAL